MPSDEQIRALCAQVVGASTDNEFKARLIELYEALEQRVIEDQQKANEASK